MTLTLATGCSSMGSIEPCHYDLGGALDWTGLFRQGLYPAFLRIWKSNCYQIIVEHRAQNFLTNDKGGTGENLDHPVPFFFLSNTETFMIPLNGLP